MKQRLSSLRECLRKRRTTILFFLGVLTFSLSFIQINTLSIERETRIVQRNLLQKLKILDNYAKRAITISPTEWVRFESFPDDMVLYKYNADTLQSWINLFPISNDEVDLIPLWYRIHDMNNRNLYNTPLAYIGNSEQYVNLGSSWYVVKTYKERDVKIIAGILIRTEYLSPNSALVNSVNRKLGLDKKFTTTPIYADNGMTIFGLSGDALFSINNNASPSYDKSGYPLKWCALLLILASIISFHNSRRDLKSFIFSIIGITLVRIGTLLLSKDASPDNMFFSPNLYADNNFFNSLGSLLINHILIFLGILTFFMCRKGFIKNLYSSVGWRRRIKKWGIILIPILLATYIHFSLKSLILNSNITLELYKLDEISIYSILVYICYALLFMALLFCLHIVYAVYKRNKRRSLFSIRSMLFYTLIVTIYSNATVGYFGFKKEYENNRVWTEKLAIERDLSLELQLRNIESRILSDPLIKIFAGMKQGEDLIRNRLAELYFWNMSQKYDIRITICGEGDKLITGNYPYPVDCYNFFKNEIIQKYGIPLAQNSAFYYVNNYKNIISYIGAFSFFGNNIRYDMYLEIDSKPTSEAIGYPSLLLDYREINDAHKNYSYAKYFDRRLTSSRGRYNYPVYFDTQKVKNGFSFQTINGYIHFFNKVSKENIIVVSRQTRNIIPYVVSFSYIYLFFSAIIFGLTRISRRRRGEVFNLPKHSFRKKITYLLTASMVFSLIAMGIGSVIFTIRLINENNRIQMEEKLQSVQTTISDMCKYAQRYNEINNVDMYMAMDRVAANTKVDINLFDPTGRLIRSTKPEVFDQYLACSRINPKAYYKLIYENKTQFIQEEAIAKAKFYSLYAPIFNINGTMIAIANIPYFQNTNEFREDASSIIAAIINLYLLLLLAAILGGIAISNSLSKPLAEISNKMEAMDISQKPEHINYKSNDELGVLVKAYNKMVDDLDKSTKQLAQSEREQAWREMARQIAHEIKNPLTPMRLSIQHLVRLKRQNVPNWQNRFDSLSASLIEQIDILSETATEFSSFAKFYNEENISVDLIELIKEQFVLFDNRENIAIQFETLFDSAIVFTKKSQITRALVNLISNAIQAIEYKRNGLVKITLSQNGEYYKIEIEDNGNGVTEENLVKLFKPNFTTKTGGTGLGLAISKNIVDQSHGKIYYLPSELGGANFVIELPIHLQG